MYSEVLLQGYAATKCTTETKTDYAEQSCFRTQNKSRLNEHFLKIKSVFKK